jgi:hypothetical protein
VFRNDPRAARVGTLADVRHALVVLGLIVCAVTLSGCGASTKIQRVGNVIEIGRAVQSASLIKSILGVRLGTSAAVARSRLGAPAGKQPLGRYTCWVYLAHQPGYVRREIDLCMSHGRVAGISLGAIHG